MGDPLTGLARISGTDRSFSFICSISIGVGDVFWSKGSVMVDARHAVVVTHSRLRESGTVVQLSLIHI